MTLLVFSRTHQITLYLVLTRPIFVRFSLLAPSLICLLPLLLLRQYLGLHFFFKFFSTLICGVSLELLGLDSVEVPLMLLFSSLFILGQLIWQVELLILFRQFYVEIGLVNLHVFSARSLHNIRQLCFLLTSRLLQLLVQINALFLHGFLMTRLRLLLPLLDLVDHVLARHFYLGPQLFGSLLAFFLLGEHLAWWKFTTFVCHFAMNLRQNTLNCVTLGRGLRLRALWGGCVQTLRRGTIVGVRGCLFVEFDSFPNSRRSGFTLRAKRAQRQIWGGIFEHYQTFAAALQVSRRSISTQLIFALLLLMTMWQWVWVVYSSGGSVGICLVIMLLVHHVFLFGCLVVLSGVKVNVFFA